MKKKGCRRNVSSTKVSRSQKRSSENAQAQEKKVSELITSSVRRQRVALQKKNEVPAPVKVSTRGSSLVRNGPVDACQSGDEVVDAFLNHESHEEGADRSAEKTIFSPTFHSNKSMEGNLTKGANSTTCNQTGQETYQHHGIEMHVLVEDEKCDDLRITSTDRICSSNLDMDEDISSKTSYTSFSDMMVNPDSDAQETDCNMEIDGARLSCEVSAIYVAMKNSKLECVDEHGQETLSADLRVQDEEYDDFDDFDPYFFIKNLPDLSSVVPTFRPMLLPKQTRSCPSTSLVLDLDETLVHSTLEPCDDADFTFPVNFNLQEYTVYVRCRPHLRDFMERVAGLFEIIIFTASQSIYAEQLLNVLDPKRKVFRHRVYRDSCVYVEGNYLKDLSVLGRDLSRVIIIDNSPQAFGFQVDNGIPIESWFDDRADQELLRLLPFLESLVGVDDVRPLISKKYNLREKIAAAGYPPLNLRRGDLLER